MSDRITEALRPKERDAQRIEIECIDRAGSEDEYIVTVYPKSKSREPGKESKGMGGYVEPFKRTFHGESDTLKYLKQIL